jgi:hypothetical protein
VRRHIFLHLPIAPDQPEINRLQTTEGIAIVAMDSSRVRLLAIGSPYSIVVVSGLRSAVVERHASADDHICRALAVRQGISDVQTL